MLQVRRVRKRGVLHHRKQCQFETNHANHRWLARYRSQSQSRTFTFTFTLACTTRAHARKFHTVAHSRTRTLSTRAILKIRSLPCSFFLCVQAPGDDDLSVGSGNEGNVTDVDFDLSDTVRSTHNTKRPHVRWSLSVPGRRVRAPLAPRTSLRLL
jgi:hypothetical protein